MKALISGAGIAGLSTAIALKRAGWSVTIVERARGLRDGGYVIDFFGPGYDAAADLGVLDPLKTHAHDVDLIDFVDSSGRHRSSINYRLLRKGADGKLFPILRGDVEKVLHDALPQDAELRYGTEITGIESRDDGVTTTLSDGSVLDADLLVGADGIHSDVRHRVFGPEADFINYLGFHTAAYFFKSAEVSRVLKGRFMMMTVYDRMASYYQLADGRILAFLVMRAQTQQRPSDPRAELMRVYGDLGWVVPDALAAAPAAHDIYYDVVAQVQMPAWHRQRVMLLGDAAYAVSLLAGQGASLAIAGGRGLGQVLSKTGDVDAALASMERRLRPLVLEKQKAGRRMAGWFVPPTPAHELVRDVALNAMNWPPLTALMSRFFSISSKGFSLARN